jgi:peptidoglycan-associated lipoprotein
MFRARYLPAMLVLAALGLTACHKKPEVAPAPAATPSATNDQQRIRDSLAALEAQRRAAEEARRRFVEDSIARANAAHDQASMHATLTAMIHFDFDKSDLRDDARAILDAKLPILLANPNVTIRIAGHTDERGGAEYNLALGQRRAAEAKRYLVSHGVAETRIETISYGAERPIASGNDESAWSQNRRDEFEITSGNGPLKAPGT